MSFYTKKLIRRLREMGFNIPEGTTVQRTYAGRHQRSAGAYSWTFQHIDSKYFGVGNIGSMYLIKDLARAKKICVYKHDGDIELFPEK